MESRAEKTIFKGFRKPKKTSKVKILDFFLFFVQLNTDNI